MADKDNKKIKKSDASDVLKDDDVKVESSTSVHHIKDVPLEQFTKVNIFNFIHYF